MATSAVQPQQLTLRRFVGGLVEFVRKSWYAIAVSFVVSGAVGWLTNVLVMADRYDGFRVPNGGLATGQGNMLQGATFWFLFSMVVSSTITYMVVVGPDRFIAELRSIPEALRVARLRDGQDAAIHVLIGVAATMLVVLLVGPPIAGALAAATVVAFLPVLRPVVIGGLSRLYRAVMRTLAPSRPIGVPAVMMTIGLVGTALGFLLGMLVSGTAARLGIGVLAAIGAVVLAQNNKAKAGGDDADGGGGAVAGLLVLGGAIVLWLLDVAPAFADDGGFSECGNPGWIGYLFDCGGSVEVFVRGVVGGVATGTGTGIGTAIGGAVGTGTSGPGPGGGPDGTGGDGPGGEDPDGIFDAIGGGEGDPSAGPDGPGTDGSGPEAGDGAGAGGGTGPEDDDEDDEDQPPTDPDDVEITPTTQGDPFRNGREVREAWDHWGSPEGERERLAQYAEEWRRSGHTEGADSDAFRRYVDDRTELDYTMLSYRSWRQQQPDAPPDAWRTTDWNPQVGGAVDVTAETIDTVMLIMEGPGIVKGVWNGGKWVIREGPDFARWAYREGPGLVKQAPKTADDIWRWVKSNTGVEKVRRTADAVELPALDPRKLAQRDDLVRQAMDGKDVKLTTQQAEDLFGIDKRILDERGGTILQSSEGAAEGGMASTYKLSVGEDGALHATRMRQDHSEVWTGKWNPVGDKGYKQGEEVFMPADVKAKFDKHPLKPGETINYTPVKPDNFDDLPPNLQAQYHERLDKAGSWDSHTGVHNAKVVDYADPKSQKYGDMWVPEDSSSPVAEAKFWKDPVDDRVYVQYKTEDGVWHAPRRQTSDVDTVTHRGSSRQRTDPNTGEKVQDYDYETSRDMQYNQAGGQLGEGDSARWGMDMLTKDSSGNLVLKGGADKDQFYKALDATHKATTELVIEQDLDGVRLVKANIPQYDDLVKAAQNIDWSPEQATALRNRGILP